jgi:hypothetical protein
VATVFGPECERPTTSDDRDGLSVEELVEYCQIQAGLLAGRTETIGAGADALLDDDGGRDALERVLRFERDHVAPAHFDDRQTLLEAAQSGE